MIEDIDKISFAVRQPHPAMSPFAELLWPSLVDKPGQQSVAFRAY